MKEKIGIEKLIELLNEYRRIDFVPERQEGVLTVAEEKVISKKFGFIKWLVENEKIDFEGKLNTLRFESLVDQTLDSYLALLMLLSISNSPIEDLLLYLK